MAGPGIRYHFMARELAKDFSVTVGFFDKDYIPPLGFPESYTTQYIPRDSFSESFSDFDIIIAMWLSDEMIEYCHNNNKFIVFDMYAPVPVENLALFLYSGNPITPHTDQEYLASCVMYDNFLRNGDLFLVSNQRQLDLWIGYMFGADQARVTSYEWRPFFDRFVYAPMGIDARMSLKKTNKVLRDVIPGIGKDDKVLIWTGGIWNWYDGQVLVHAMARLKTTHPEIKLVFFGTKHPNPNVPEMKETTRTHDLAVQLGLLGENVFMQQTWVPYNDRIDYLLEADVAINTNKPSIESEFSQLNTIT